MIARSSQRYGRPDRLQSGQHELEPEGILRGEEAGQEVLMRIVVVQFRLKAEDFLVHLAEPVIRFFQLKRIGDVFRVVDDDVFSARHPQPVVTGFGLGLRVRGWNHDNLEISRQIKALGYFLGFQVILFKQQLDFKAGFWPI